MSCITYAVLSFTILTIYQGAVNGGCGIPQVQPTLPYKAPSTKPAKTRIIGGNNAVPNSWPWTVLVYVDTGFMCGGALINVDDNPTQADKILTAAHCVVDDYGAAYNPGQFTIILGAQNFQDSANEPNQVWKQVVSVKPHEKYDPTTTNNDVALLKLNTPVTFSKYVQPICLPQTSAPADPSKCYAVGWGRVSNDNSTTADVLQQVLLPVLSDTTCASSWGSNYNSSIMLCAGYLNGTKSTCQGDSGGPLVCKEADGHFTHYGAVSFGNGELGANGLPQCAAANRPGVFARTKTYMPWIQTTVAST